MTTILVPEINIWTPPMEAPTWMRKLMEPRRIIISTAIFGGETVGNVTLTGESIDDAGAGDRLYRAALVVRATGITDEIVNTTTTQIQSGTDWIIPNGDASSSYDVKYDLDLGDTLDASTSLADGVWGDIGTDQFFEQRWAAGAGVGGNSSDITVSIRFLGGAPLDTGPYTLHAERLF